MAAAGTGVYREVRHWRASLYRLLRRLHLWVTVAAAVPFVLLSLTGALLVFGHELETLIMPPIKEVVPVGQPLSFQTILDRVKAQKPDLTVWSIGTGQRADGPWQLWLAGGAGALSVDPYTGEVLRHFNPGKTPYGIVKALHRRWLVDGKPWAPLARNVISVLSLAMMFQVFVGLWLWALPPKRLQRLKPDFRHSGRLAVQRLHLSAGVITGLILMLISFTGIAMWWHDTMEHVVEAVTGSQVEKPVKPSAAGLAPLSDLDTAVALALAQVPGASVAHFRAPSPDGEPLMIAMHTPDTYTVSRVWVGDHPPRVLDVFDGRNATAATWFWNMRYWLHIGDFAGWPVRVLWLVIALAPTGFVVSGLWLWRNRVRRRGVQG